MRSRPNHFEHPLVRCVFRFQETPSTPHGNSFLSFKCVWDTHEGGAHGRKRTWWVTRILVLPLSLPHTTFEKSSRPTAGSTADRGSSIRYVSACQFNSIVPESLRRRHHEEKGDGPKQTQPIMQALSARTPVPYPLQISQREEPTSRQTHCDCNGGYCWLSEPRTPSALNDKKMW